MISTSTGNFPVITENIIYRHHLSYFIAKANFRALDPPYVKWRGLKLLDKFKSCLNNDQDTEQQKERLGRGNYKKY